MSTTAGAKYRPNGDGEGIANPPSSLDEEFKISTPSPEPPPADQQSQQPKDPRSKHKYNIFIRFFLFWLDPLFWYGSRHDLNQSDLYAHPSEADSEKLHLEFDRYWKQELGRKALGKKPRLWVVLAKSFKWRFLLQGAIAFIEVAMLVGQSLLLGELVDYFTDVGRGQFLTECIGLPSSETLSTTEAYMAALGLLLLALFVAFLHAHYALISTKIGMMARIMTTSAVYHKLLALSQSTINNLTVGHVINVVSNDVQKFDLAFLFLPFLWIAPLHIIVFTYLVYQEVEWVVFITLFFFILQIPIQLVLAKVFKKFRFKSDVQTDKRVLIMNEVITGIRVIKMYAWEHAFKKVVTALRKREIRLIKVGGLIRNMIASFNFGVALSLFMAITFLTYVGTGHDLTPRKVIITLSLLTFLRNISASFLIRSVFLLFEAKVAVTRIQDILEQEELTPEEIEALQTGTKKLDSKVSKEGFFRESPWLAGLRKIKHTEEPVEVTSVTVPTSVETVLTPPTEIPSNGATGTPTRASPSPEDKGPVLRAALQNSITIQGLTASWTNDEGTPTLKNVSLEVNEEKRFLAVVGRVGSGKSSLLQCLLGELKALRGSVDVSGRVSYASQTPWVFSGTVRENILFGALMNTGRYNKVVDACALRQDFNELPQGDLSRVGERGVTLSGGQKARVNLARAVYHDADIYLLDDPLSAVDTVVAKQIFEKCVRGLLFHSQVVLVTHQVQFAVRADQLLALKEGEVQLYHTKEELDEKGVDQHLLLKMLKDRGAEFVYDDVDDDDDNEEDELDGDDDDEDEDDFDGDLPITAHPLSPIRMESTSSFTYRSILNRTDSVDARRVAGFEDSISSVTRQRYASLNRNDNFLSSIVEGQGYLNSQTSLDAKDDVDDPDGLNEEKAHGTISIKTYFQFFKAGANYAVLFIVLVLFLLSESGVVITDSWLSEWSICDEINITLYEQCNRSVKSICFLTEDQRMGIYGGLTLTTIVLNFIRTTLFYLICINASRVLHNRMFKAIIRTSIRFFDINPSGRVLNRFSKDIGFLDDLLPHTFLEYLFLLLRFLAVLATASYGNPYVLIPAALIIVGFVLLRWYFLKTSRDIKRLEAIARSPVYSHFSITLQGLSTIRTLGKQDLTQQLFHKYQNQHTQGWYLYLASSRWFGMRIDLISALYLGVVAFISVRLAEDLDAGIIGLGLAYTIALAGILQYCVRQSAEVENIMISTERIMGYGKLEPEAPLETQPPNTPPPEDWPHSGVIKMSNVRFRYSKTLPYVINNLRFSVKPSEKIGIVGRTGAGKSSLISILFRLAEPEGDITIDAIDTRSIGLHELRGKISIIPQDPVLFSGSVRYNLDPCEEYLDEKLWGALEQVELKSVVEQMPGRLQEEVAEGGANFSAGQKQLMCLARALLKGNKILVLDEATANVDPGTDQIIQKTIRANFRECTVLTIAHRLNTIMDSDRIIVMRNGRIAEFDTPYELLQRENSLLYKMVEKTGAEAAKELKEMAQRL